MYVQTCDFFLSTGSHKPGKYFHNISKINLSFNTKNVHQIPNKVRQSVANRHKCLIPELAYT